MAAQGNIGTSEGDHAWLVHKQNIPPGTSGGGGGGDYAWLHKQNIPPENIPTCLGPVSENVSSTRGHVS